MNAPNPTPKPGMTKPIDLVHRYNPSNPRSRFVPLDWQAARERLEHDNEQVVRFFDACRAGAYPEGTTPSLVEIAREDVELEPRGADGFPAQLPFAVIVGCADARVPAELLFGQDFNALFNIRVAGNVLADECVGSVLYALDNFVSEGPERNRRGLKLIVALGHRGCGAVNAAVQAYRRDATGATIGADPVGTILRRIFSPAVTLSARALDVVFGPGTSADERFHPFHVEVAVYLNVAWQAHDLREWVVKTGDEAAAKVGVVYGVAEPGRLRVRAKPPNSAGPSDGSRFGVPPRDLEELYAQALDMTRELHDSFGGPPTFHTHRAFFP